MPRAWSKNASRLLAVTAAFVCLALMGSSLTWSEPTAQAATTRYKVVYKRCMRHHHHHHHHHLRRHRRRCRRLARRATASASGSGSTSKSTPATVPMPVSPDFYGVNGESFSPKFMPASQWGPHLQAIHDAGFTSVRRQAWWCDVERKAPVGGVHTYDWAELDQFVTALAQHDLRWYATISPGAGWAGSSWAAPPSDAHIPDYAAFAAALASRYGENGTFWAAHPALPYEPVRDFEVWNEPDLPRFWVDDPATAPERYGRMVAATIPAVHAVDPNANVIAGALAPSGAAQWLGEMVQANPELQGEISTVSFHPYGLNATRGLNRIVDMRHAIDQWLGRGVGMVISEDGISEPPGSRFTVDDRAALWRTEAMTLPRTDCNITGFLPHSWTEPAQDPTQPDQWYGMADWNTAQLDPSGVALTDAMKRMEGLSSTPPPSTRVNLCYG